MTKTRNALLIILTLVSSMGLILILSGYWQPIFWAVVVAILLRPAMSWFERHWPGHAGLSAGAIMVGLVAASLLPILFLGSALVSQAEGVYQDFQSGALSTQLIVDWVDSFYETRAGQWLSSAGWSASFVAEKAKPLLVQAERTIVSWVADLGQITVGFVMSLMLMLYLLFFFLSNGPGLYRSLYAAVPMPDEEKSVFFEKFADVASATILGTYVVGIVQGALGAGFFAILGISGALFWGLLMAALSLVPAVGAAIVWFPAAILLIVAGSWTQGLALLVFGAVVISSVDNLLRPLIVGKRAQMPDFLVLLSTLGGLATFGITGFVVGPVIAAFCIASWHLVDEHNV